MIFSKAKWNNGKEIGKYVPTSASLGFDKMESSLESASDLFLLPLLGNDMMTELEFIYSTAEGSRSAAEQQLLELAQRAVANLAMWYNFDALQLRITDQGFQRQGSEDWQQAYKYQEDRLREGFKTKGFNAVDQLLDFLEDNVSAFDDYAESPAHIDRSTALVKDTEEVQKWVNVGHSRLMFLRFAAEFPTVEEDVLRPELGGALYAKLLAWISGDESYPVTYEVTLEEFRAKCVRVMVAAAAIRLLKQTGSLTERGLYFEDVAAVSTENHIKRSANDVQIGNRLEMYQSDSRMALAALRTFIRENYSDIVEQKNGHFVRDNDGHAGFFAM
jgi:hypothetical protein